MQLLWDAAAIRLQAGTGTSHPTVSLSPKSSRSPLMALQQKKGVIALKRLLSTAKDSRDVGVPLEEGCGNERGGCSCTKATATGNTGTAAENQAISHTVFPRQPHPSPHSFLEPGAASPDDMIDDDGLRGHQQGVKPLWDFRELHPLRLEYL